MMIFFNVNCVLGYEDSNTIKPYMILKHLIEKNVIHYNIVLAVIKFEHGHTFLQR